jgi:hypothetical protein
MDPISQSVTYTRLDRIARENTGLYGAFESCEENEELRIWSQAVDYYQVKNSHHFIFFVTY